MRFNPVSASASIRRTLSATGIIFFSDWKPSRGPSSSITTRLGRSDMTGLLRTSGLFFLESLLPCLVDAGQGHQQQQQSGGDQQAETDRPLDEYRRLAARQQHGSPEVLLHLGPEHEAEQERRAFAAQADEDVAQHAEHRDLHDVERAVL